MIRNFTHWLDLVGNQVSKMREERVGVIYLTFFTNEEEDALFQAWQNGVKPKDAARSYLLARGELTPR